jgi:hypothetical protein
VTPPRFGVAGLMAVLAAHSAPPPAHAAASGPDTFRVRRVAPHDVLHVREAPSRSSRQVGSIPHDGTGIVNLGCVQARGGKALPPSDRPRGALWCKVRYAWVEGWAFGRYLAEE